MKGSVKRDKRNGFLNGEDKFSLRETFGLVEKETGCFAPRRGELSFVSDGLFSFSSGKGIFRAPARGAFFFLSPTGHFLFLAKEELFRAPARVTFGRSPKSYQKVCLKPKVSRLPARYALWLSVAFTTRSRGI